MGIDGDADARCDHNLVTLHEDGPRQRIQNAPGDLSRIARFRETFKQHDELVASRTGDHHTTITLNVVGDRITLTQGAD